MIARPSCALTERPPRWNSFFVDARKLFARESIAFKASSLRNTPGRLPAPLKPLRDENINFAPVRGREPEKLQKGIKKNLDGIGFEL